MLSANKVAALLESARHLHQPSKNTLDEKRILEGQYRLLSQVEASELGRLALSTLSSGSKADTRTLEEVLVSLACLVPGALTGLHQEIIAQGMFYPPEIFLGADAESRNMLIERVGWDVENRNHLLTALAWIGDAAVQRQFRLWRDAPPDWRQSLHVGPEIYAQEAGWVLTPDGGRRDLFSFVCYTLVRLPETAAAAADSPVTVIEAHSERCRWCGWEMTVLFDFDLASPRLAFLDLQGQRLRIVMCDRCSGFTAIFMNVDREGNSVWAQENKKPEFLGWERADYSRLPVNRMTLGAERRSPYEANWQVLEEGHSQIGGHPAWVQDAEYPACPVCNELMPFVAQLQTYDLEEFSEGTTYAFYCEPCGKTATVYQQT